MKKAFDHIGIPTSEPHPGESWVPFSQVWVTNPRTHPQRIEYIRPKEPPQVPPDQVGLWKLWHWPHVAYRVDDLRAALEGELSSLESFLDSLMTVIRSGGRLVVIAFHSLEDRIVKQKFRTPPVPGRALTKKVVVATEEEVRRNPRARSAKLRAWEKS